MLAWKLPRRRRISSNALVSNGPHRLAYPDKETPPSKPFQPRILIIGAGMSGILTAIQLRKAGYSCLRIYEKASQLGGTWRDNTYPGLRCDVPAHMFTYSFAANPEYSHRFPLGSEIQSYLQRVAEEHGLDALIQYGRTVQRATFQSGKWYVETVDDGVEEFDVVICATGVLHHPKMPEIPGIESFRGQSFHTARWNHAVSLKNKRIAVIGTGATAAQIVPPLQSEASSLFVFQRTPQWIFPMPNKTYRETDKARLRNNPALAARLYARYSKIFQWTFARAVIGNRALIFLLKAFCKSHLKRKVKDPELRAKLTPNYECGCKRLVFGKGFYQAIQAPNAKLVTDSIAEIEADCIRTTEGTRYAVDVIIYATGFHGHRYMRPMEVVGRERRSLNEVWSDGAMAHHSTGVPGFPNFFLLFGPYSPIGNYSAMAVAEVQVNHIIKQLNHLRETQQQLIEPRVEAMQRQIELMQKAMRKTVWVSGCASWYLDEHGKSTMWPSTFERYQRSLSRLDPSDYQVSGVDPQPSTTTCLELRVDQIACNQVIGTANN